MRVLLIEDDKDYLQNCLAEIEKDYVVDVAYTGNDGAFMSEVNDYDAIVIDSSLPDKKACSVCKEAREVQLGVPILVLADKDDNLPKIEYIKNGANVCIDKTTAGNEICTHIKALTSLQFKSTRVVNLSNNVTVNLDNQNLTNKNGEITLRKKEFRILEYLLKHRKRTVTKEELLDHIWEDGILVKSNSLEVHMRNLRQKIASTSNEEVIKTVRGFGYKID